MQTFDYVGIGTPNPHVVQGSNVYICIYREREMHKAYICVHIPILALNMCVGGRYGYMCREDIKHSFFLRSHI